jgi:hypothetical protein
MAELHQSIIALVSLSAGIASNHPAMGQCQLARLRKAGIDESQIATVIEIARHIRDEAASILDQSFNEKAYAEQTETLTELAAVDESTSSSCCSSTASGQSCC